MRVWEGADSAFHFFPLVVRNHKLLIRRGTVLSMDMKGDLQLVNARVPLASMFGYATAIRSLTKGRASYSMETDQFELAPKNVREEILSK